jgi:hypothetical protein
MRDSFTLTRQRPTARLLDAGQSANPIVIEPKATDTLADHLPSVALMPSHTATPRPVTITVMTALNI